MDLQDRIDNADVVIADGIILARPGDAGHQAWLNEPRARVGSLAVRTKDPDTKILFMGLTILGTNYSNRVPKVFKRERLKQFAPVYERYLFLRDVQRAVYG